MVFFPAGDRAITIKINKVINPKNRKNDSKLVAKKLYIFNKFFALPWGSKRTYDERITKKLNVIARTVLLQRGFNFILIIVSKNKAQ